MLSVHQMLRLYRKMGKNEEKLESGSSFSSESMNTWVEGLSFHLAGACHAPYLQYLHLADKCNHCPHHLKPKAVKHNKLHALALPVHQRPLSLGQACRFHAAYAKKVPW
jgi:hypothetical protein